MKDYLWPENISEIRKTIQQIISQERGSLITAAMLPPKIKQATSKTYQTKHNNFQHISIPLWQIEKDAIERIIRLCKGDIVQAANILEISPSTIYRKIQKWEKRSS